MLGSLLSSTAILTGLVLAADNATRNDGIHLAIGPTCGKLTTTGNPSDLNAGLGNITRYKTIVSWAQAEYDCL
jgi:hypothetical protein